jgi:hypothetical protein
MEDSNSQLIDLLIKGRKLEAIALCKEFTGKDLKSCKDYIDFLESQIPANANTPETNNENEINLNELKRFYNQNSSLLFLDMPFDKWNDTDVLFSSNDKIKGKVYFKLNKIEFKLKNRLWAPYSLSGVRDYNSEHWFKKPLEIIKNGEFIFPSDENGKLIYDQIPSLCLSIKEANQNYLIECEQKRNQEISLAETNRLQNLYNKMSQVLIDLDKNNDGNVDLVENDFNKLLNKNQKTILGVDAKYIHQFVKVSNFIKTKSQNTQKIFESIRDTSSQEELEERVALLKNQIHSYELLVFHSINMIGALVSQDLITFYEIYESFDKLGMFNSNWENEVSVKLSNIGDKLNDLMQSIYNMELNIVSELSHLSYVTQESFEDLNRSVTSQLREVQSSINTNNLLTGIQTYQLYKINRNTKSLSN